MVTKIKKKKKKAANNYKAVVRWDKLEKGRIQQKILDMKSLNLLGQELELGTLNVSSENFPVIQHQT